MKKNNSYSIDFINKVITLTQAFAKKAQDPQNPEHHEMLNLLNTFPTFTFAMRKATKKADKETHKGLSVPRIEKFIARQPNSEELMSEYKAFVDFWSEEVVDKKTGKKVRRTSYGKIKKWFLDKFPNYQEMLDFSVNVEKKDTEPQTFVAIRTEDETINEKKIA